MSKSEIDLCITVNSIPELDVFHSVISNIKRQFQLYDIFYIYGAVFSLYNIHGKDSSSQKKSFQKNAY